MRGSLGGKAQRWAFLGGEAIGSKHGVKPGRAKLQGASIVSKAPGG